MRLFLFSFVCVIAILPYYTTICRKVSNGLSDSTPNNGQPINQMTEERDGCKRKYPLSAENKKQVPLAFNQYGISPDWLETPPTGYLEVSSINSISKIILFGNACSHVFRSIMMGSTVVSQIWATK